MAEWLNLTFANFDYLIFNLFYNLRVNAGAFFTPFFQFVTFLGDGGLIYIIAGVICLLFKSTRKLGVTMLLALALGSLTSNLIIKPIVLRPRPFTANSFYYENWLAVGATKVGENSFPSGHTTAVFTCTLSWILLSNKKWRFLGIAFAVLMASSRVYLFVHYTTDILGGIIVGCTMAILVSILVKKLFKTFENKTENKVFNFIVNSSVTNLIKKNK